MKTRKIIKLVYILIILITLLAQISKVQAVVIQCPTCKGTGILNGRTCQNCKGSKYIDHSGTSASSGATTINPEDFRPGDLTDSDTAVAFQSAGVIVNAIINVGLVISIVMFMVLGMKYMIGSIEERAEYKKTLMPMVIGTLMIFISGKIVSTIWNIMSQVNV